MRVIPPITIFDGMLTSSTAPEPGTGEQIYNPATTYAQGDQVILGSPSSTVTISNAAPAVVSWATHNQPDGTPVVLTTTGTLPAGLTAGRVYYVVNGTSGTFQVAATVGGTGITTTSAGTGTHTATTQVHRKYQSLQASNTGKYPLLAASSTWWLDVGPTNRWAAFDLLRNTATEVASPLTIVITPGVRVDSIGLIGLVGDSATVTVTVLESTVYTYTQSLNKRSTVGWYSYFFNPFKSTGALALIDLPPYSGAVITITITRATGLVTCGGIILGTSVYLGKTQYNAVDDALNFSLINRDQYGTSYVVQRRTVPKTIQKVWSEKGRLAQVREARDTLNAVPALWTGIDDNTDGYFDSLLILGIYKQFSINLSLPTVAEISLELEEI